MAFFEIVFPVNYSYGAVGGCGWSTRVVTTDSGTEYRQGMWAGTRGEWHVGHNLRKPSEWGILASFHRVMRGKLNGFRFRDWTDYTHESGPGVGDRPTGVFLNPQGGVLQLQKQYSLTDLFNTVFGSGRWIEKPAPGTIQVYVGATNALRTGWVLDYTTGRFTNAGNIVSGDSWTGSFHVPCRFDTDRPDLSVDLPAGVGWRGIPIVELKGE